MCKIRVQLLCQTWNWYQADDKISIQGCFLLFAFPVRTCFWCRMSIFLSFSVCNNKLVWMWIDDALDSSNDPKNCVFQRILFPLKRHHSLKKLHYHTNHFLEKKTKKNRCGHCTAHTSKNRFTSCCLRLFYHLQVCEPLQHSRPLDSRVPAVCSPHSACLKPASKILVILLANETTFRLAWFPGNTSHKPTTKSTRKRLRNCDIGTDFYFQLLWYPSGFVRIVCARLYR